MGENGFPQRLLRVQQRLPAPRRYWVAYSGGLDSSALLHALWTLGEPLAAPLAALHIDHGLHADSKHWADHCAAFCDERGIPFQNLEIHLQPAPGESVEAAARFARYRALAACMQPDDMLLTAQHRDDQAETVLLQLLRGSGPAGLAAMPECIRFGPGWHARPMLALGRDAIRDYVEEQGLNWCEDPSNRNTRFDRNFLRNQVIPLLKTRWPGLDRTLSRSATHCAEAQALLDQWSEEALGELMVTGFQGEAGLDLGRLLSRPLHRQKALLRAWIRHRGFAAPNAERLREILDQVRTARAERAPAVCWPGAELRRYQGILYLMPPIPAADPTAVVQWAGEGGLELPAGLGRLTALPASSGIAVEAWRDGSIEVRFRRGGERCRAHPEQPERDLKALFQATGVPPWLRPSWPLIYIDGRLAAVAGLGVCTEFQASAGAPAIRVLWERRPGGTAECGSALVKD